MFRSFSDYVKLFTGTFSNSDTPHEVATAVPSAVLGHSGRKYSLCGRVSENITQCAYSGVSLYDNVKPSAFYREVVFLLVDALALGFIDRTICD